MIRADNGEEGVPPNRTVTAGLVVLFFSIPLSISLMQAGLALALVGALPDVLRRKGGIPRTPIDLPVLLFIGVTFLSASLSGDPVRGLRQAAGGWTVTGLYLLARYGRDERLLRRLTGILLWTSAAVALYAVFQHFTGIDFIRPGKPLESLLFGGRLVYFPRGAFSHYQTFSNVFYLLFCLSFGQALHNRELATSRLWKAAALVIGAVLVFSYTRGIWIAASLAVLFQSLLSGWRKALAGIFVSAGLVAVLFALAPGGLASRARTIVEMERNVERLLLWETTWNMIRDHPLLGVGVGNYQRVQAEYLREEVPMPMTRSHSHNIFLQVTVERGLFGLLLFLWMWYLIVKEGFRTILKLRVRGGTPYGLALGCLAGLLGFLLDGLFQNNFGDTEVLVLFWIILGVLFRRWPDLREAGAAKVT